MTTTADPIPPIREPIPQPDWNAVVRILPVALLLRLFPSLVWFGVLVFALSFLSGCRPAFQSMAQIQERYALPALPRAEDYPEHDAVVVLSTTETELYLTERGLATDQVIHRIVRVFRNPEERANVEIDLFPGEELVSLEARFHDPAGRVVPVSRAEIDLGRASVPSMERGSVSSHGSRPGEASASDDVGEPDEASGPDEGSVSKDVSGPEDDRSDPEPYVADAPDADMVERNTIRLRFSGLVPGSSYEYRYRLRRREPYLYDSWAVQEYDPVLYTHYTLTVPRHLFDAEGREWDWRYRYYRCARIGAPEVTEQVNRSLGNTETYRWTLRDISGFRPEPRMPAHEEYMAFARFAHNAWSSWDEVTRSYWRSHLKAVLEPDRRVAEALAEILEAGIHSVAIGSRARASGAPPTPALLKSRREIGAIARYVQGLGNIDLELGQGSLTPSRPAKVLERGRADAKDKAVLLVALLRAAGYPADPALVVTRDHGPLDRDFPNWSFNHMLVLVDHDERTWIDPTVRHYPLGELPWRCEGVEAVVVRPEGGAEVLETPRPVAQYNTRLAEIRLEVAPDGRTSGEVQLVIDGEPGSLLLEELDRAESRYEAVRSYCESEIRESYPDASVLTAELRETSPGRALVEFGFETANLLVLDDVLPHLSPAPLPFDSGLDLVAQVERRYPVDNGYPARWIRRVTVDLSASPYEIVAVPAAVDIHDREVVYRSRYERQGTNGLYGEETLELEKPRLLTRTYKIAREILEAEEMAGMGSVVLRRTR